jgi:hypothetical protein
MLVKPARGRLRRFLTLLMGIALLAAVGSAGGDVVLVEHFNDGEIDPDLWTVIDSGNDGVTIDEVNGRLEFSSDNSEGTAGIYAESWAISTGSDARLSVDYFLDIPDPPPLVVVGLTISLIANGDPAQNELEDGLEIGIFRQGEGLFVQWLLWDEGLVYDSGISPTPIEQGTVYLTYDESVNTLWISGLGFGQQPDAFVVEEIVAAETEMVQVYLGGFVFVGKTTVNGSNAWADRMRLVEGEVVDLVSVQSFSARVDSDWFKRGGSAGDRFGWSARFAGDVNNDGLTDVIAGAPRYDTNTVNTVGRASIYSGADGSALFHITGDDGGDQLGFAVDSAGDFDGDGWDDLLVGAPKDDTAAGNAGAVYVYSGQTHDVLWTGYGEAVGDQFGFSVAGLGDIDNDGYDDFIVGAPLSDAGGDNAGRAYVYFGNSGALFKRKTGQDAGDQFGRVVSGAGDVDDDGQRDWIVSAPLDGAGKVSIYSGADGTRIRALVGVSGGDRLGWSASEVGDLNDDGYDDVLLGAPNNDAAAGNAGAAYVFSGQNGSMLLELLGEAAGDKLGWAAAGLRDLNGDGTPDLAVSAPRHDAAGGNAGRVYIHCGATGDLLATIDGENPDNQFGTSLDGDPRVVEGIDASLLGGSWRFESAGMNRRGSVYRYDFVDEF